uniref:Putative tick transposon n=1 Tax=Rhipicephalus microplus TaxID=6941 RepID=A0A6M2DBB6_RHIMP
MFCFFFFFFLSPSPYLLSLTARTTRHRHADSLTPYRTRTNLFKYSFFPRTITAWNNLPYTPIHNDDFLEHVTV